MLYRFADKMSQQKCLLRELWFLLLTSYFLKLGFKYFLFLLYLKEINFWDGWFSRDSFLHISRFFGKSAKFYTWKIYFILFILFFSLRNFCPVLFSLVSILKRIILLFNTLNCEQCKSKLYLFNYYICSNFEKTLFGSHYYHTRHKHYRSGNCQNKSKRKY